MEEKRDNVSIDLPLDSGAPLLCVGITLYSLLRYYGIDKLRMHVGVVGLDGLGHVAVIFLKALGIKVTVINQRTRIHRSTGTNYLNPNLDLHIRLQVKRGYIITWEYLEREILSFNCRDDVAQRCSLIFAA
ncbi:probable mannitol dehydrogenase [Tanacetum coccineum]